MLKRNEMLKGTTPRGVFIWPKLNKPDFEYKKEFGEFSTKLKLEGADAEKFIKLIDDFHAKAFAAESRKGKIATAKHQKDTNGLVKKGEPNFQQYSKPYTEALDSDDEVIPGAYIFKFACPAGGETENKQTGEKEVWKKTHIPLIDAKGNRVTKDVWGGSEGEVAFETMVWCNPGAGFGVSLRLKGAQVLKLRTAGSGESMEDLGFAIHDEDDAYVDDGVDSGFEEDDSEEEEDLEEVDEDEEEVDEEEDEDDAPSFK